MSTGFFFLCLLSASTYSYSLAIQFDRWFSPFNDSKKIYELCTDEMDRLVLFSEKHEWIRFYMEKWVVCYPDFHNYVKPKFKALVWFMRELRFCEIHQIVQLGKNPQQWHREFQVSLLKYSYAVICSKTRFVPESEKLNLHVYADIFRILYEKENSERKHICDKITGVYADIYGRCYVPAVEKRQRQIEDRCSGISTPFIKTPAFFQRFSRHCNSLQEFVGNNSLAAESMGKTLAKDVVFLNLLNSNLVTNINQDSELPSLVLKTRLLLQHFSLAAVKLWNQLDGIRRCRADIHTTVWNESSSVGEEEPGDTDGPDQIGVLVQQKCCIYNNSHICELQNERKFRNLAEQAWRSFYIEFALLFVVLGNTILLTVLPLKTKKHLSTATVLFIFNIMFSNLLFLSSFVCLFSDLLEETQYGPVNEDHNEKSSELIVAETLRTHLFAESEFFKHLMQETLYSLAQNGSLTGLIHLLVLVLVVINRSMSGKSIHLSRASVVSVFASVWIFLIITHIVFSTLQNNAIRYLDQLFLTLSKGRQYLQCSSRTVSSEYEEIAGHCDRTAIFHTFGAYLLRGHTLFTCLFLSLSIIIFTVTLAYHWRVRRQHDFLHSGLRKVESMSMTQSMSGEQSPHRRREMLFHTLLLSIGAFFVSVLGQTYIELAVFWMDDREQLASLTKWYHLARLVAFVDPVLNPLIVVIRTPALRRQLRAEWTSMRRSSERSRDSMRKKRSHSVSEESSTGRFTLLKGVNRISRSSIRSASAKNRRRFGSQKDESDKCLKGRKGNNTIARTIGTRRSLDSQNPSIV